MSIKNLSFVVVCGILAAGCSESPSLSSTAPAPVSVDGLKASTSLDVVVFPLLNGAFTIANKTGDRISGTYTGTATFDASQKGSVTLQVSAGSGAFAGAAGQLVLDASGAITGEGQFSLSGGGELTLANGRRADVALSLKGTSTVSCSPSARILISQSAVGNVRHVGRVEAQLTHEVGNTGCTP